MNVEQFGAYLKELRVNKGLTLRQLADLTGYTNSYLSQIETGKKGKMPTPELITKLAEHLGTDQFNLLRLAGYEELAIGKRQAYNLEENFQRLNFLEKENFELLAHFNRNLELDILLGMETTTPGWDWIRPSFKGKKLSMKKKQRILKMIELLLEEDED